MKRKSLVLLLLLVLWVNWAHAQKIKYKELLNLLNAKQYEQAEPFLRRYLKENSDNPSAFLFMGIIYQEKSLGTDVLKQTELLMANIDSALFFYEKALPKITEKEVKKNEENYQMYTRRDLRTGQFGVKHSDIVLDIETRMKALRERKDKVRLVKKSYLESEAQYARANRIYKDFQSRFATKKELYLLSDDDLILELNKLAATFDSCQASFKSYKSQSQAMGKTGYNQMLNLQEIKDFKKDGASMIDFMEDDLKLWDYTEWAKKTVRTIRDEVYPMRKDLVAFDIELNHLREKITKDSLKVDAAALQKSQVFSEMKKWDTDPMPEQVFQLKIKELEYHASLLDQSALSNSDIAKKIASTKQQLSILSKMDSLSSLLLERNPDKDLSHYKGFVTEAYGTPVVLRSFIRSTQEYVRRESTKKRLELDEYNRLLKWVITETDSIPLFMEVTDNSKYHPLVISDTHTAGLKSDSPLVGYFYTVTPSRTADLGFIFPVDTAHIKLRNLPVIKGLSLITSDQTYFVLIYSESRSEGKVPVSLTKISRQSGVEWNISITTDLVPMEMKYTASNGELSIRTSGTDGESRVVVLDKTGKRLQ
jgi:tetratricopeptide (TPR) repeat protein